VASGAPGGADVLERAMTLLEATSRPTSPEAVEAVMTEGITRCLPEMLVTFSEGDHAADGRQVVVALDPP